MAPPAPGTPPPTETWKVRVRGRATVGPFPTDLIVLGIERGKVPFESEICREGTAIWRPLASVPAFYRAMGLHRVPLPPPPVATGASDEDEVTRIAPSPGAGADPDEDDDEDETRVLEALLPESAPPRRPPTSAAGPGLPSPAVPPGRPGRAATPAPAAGAPPPPLRAAAPPTGAGALPPPPLAAHGSLGRAEDDAPTVILESPRSLAAGPALRHATPPPPLHPPGSPNEPRASAPLAATQPRPPPYPRPLPPLVTPAEPITAANLMDADDDENDVRGIHQGLSEPPGSIRPAAGAPAERSEARPAPRRSARPPVVNERPLRAHLPERADELTAPARRLRRDRQRLLIALVVLAVGLVATLAMLLVLLLRR